ncbi:MAG: peptide-methionine (R)-S-oxide reductase, partial [Paracoccaceae bacterium]
MQMNRRTVLTTLILGTAAARFFTTGSVQAEGVFAVTHTDDEWRKLLTPAQYDVLRQQGTETASTSPLLDEHRKGTFACAGCDLPLYSSDTKYDSGTGWP